ncbi:MAG: DNA polymerase, partial [Clostridia bacterium]
MKADDIRIYRQLGCDACPLAKLRNRNPRMEPTGSDEPIIYVLGGAPNYEDDVRGRQFTGESGEVLRKIFRDIIGLDYKHIIRFNNIVRTRCHEGGEDKAPPWEAIEACRPSIIADIEETKPKAIFGFGNLPLEWIADISGIYAWRGRYMAVRVGNHVCWYFPMIHPDDVQNAGVRIFHDDDAASDEESFLNEDHRILRLDIQHAWKRLQELGTPFIHTPDYARQGVEILDFYDEKGLTIIENKLKHFGQQLVVGIDYETTALRPYNSNAILLSAAVSDGQSAFAFPFDHPSAEWTRKHKERLRELWRDFLKTTKAIKAVHNLQFEQEWTVYHFGWELAHAGDWHCTQVQASIIDHRYKGSEPSPLSLDFLVRQHFGLNLKAMSNVDRSNLIRTPLPIVLEYNALDAKYHALLYKRQHSIIMKENLAMAYKFARRRVPAIVLAQIKGVPVSQKRAEKLYEKYSTRIRELEDSIANDKTVKKFETKYKQTFNPNSNADCVKLFYTMLGRKECEVYDKKKKNVKPWLGGVDGKTKVNKISCDKEVLTQLEHPLADKILALRKPQKLLSTYVLPLMKGTDESKIYDDGKLHPIFNHTFTDTGRLSCEEPNMQNFPKRSDESKE